MLRALILGSGESWVPTRVLILLKNLGAMVQRLGHSGADSSGDIHRQWTASDMPVYVVGAVAERRPRMLNLTSPLE